MLKPNEDEIETETAVVKTTTITAQPTAASAEEQEPSPPSSRPPTTTPIPQSPPPAVPASPVVAHKTPPSAKMVHTPPPAPTTASQSRGGGFGLRQAKVRMIPDGRKEQLNTRYLATLPGVLKIAEVLLGFVAFILAICADRRSTSSAWTEHITFETTIVVSVFIILYVVFPHLSLSDERTREGLVVVELLFYGLNTLFFFIGIWLMVHLAASWTAEGRGAAIMDAILCLALCVLYAVETFIKFKAWSGQDVVSRTNSPYTHRVPPAPTHAQTDVEKRAFEPAKDEEEHQVVV